MPFTVDESYQPSHDGCEIGIGLFRRPTARAFGRGRRHVDLAAPARARRAAAVLPRVVPTTALSGLPGTKRSSVPDHSITVDRRSTATTSGVTTMPAWRDLDGNDSLVFAGALVRLQEHSAAVDRRFLGAGDALGAAARRGAADGGVERACPERR